MKILLTGVGGYIGSYFASCWQNSDNVIGIMRKQRNLNIQIPIIVNDLSERISLRESVDVIVHTAAQSPFPGVTMNDYISSNVIAVQNLIHYAKEYNVKRFIYLSSISVFGDVISTTVNEATPIINPNPYGLTKYIGEQLLREAEWLPSIALCLPGVLGMGAKTAWLVQVVEKLRKNEDISFFNPQSQFNNMVHLYDLERFVKKLMYSDWNGFEKLTLGCRELLIVQEILHVLRTKLNSRSKLIENLSSKTSFVISIEKACQWGYSPMPAGEMLESLINNV